MDNDTFLDTSLPKKEFYSLQETAFVLKVGVLHVLNLLDRGHLQDSPDPGPRSVTRESLEEYYKKKFSI